MEESKLIDLHFERLRVEEWTEELLMYLENNHPTRRDLFVLLLQAMTQYSNNLKQVIDYFEK